MASATVSVCTAPTTIIEEINILHASLWAMRQAVMGLAVQPDHVLVDGNVVPTGLPCQCETVVGGDGLSVSIAAASIVAKVTRDRYMQTADALYPTYGFHSHVGYITPAHSAVVRSIGPSEIHRRSFEARCYRSDPAAA